MSNHPKKEEDLAFARWEHEYTRWVADGRRTGERPLPPKNIDLCVIGIVAGFMCWTAIVFLAVHWWG